MIGRVTHDVMLLASLKLDYKSSSRIAHQQGKRDLNNLSPLTTQCKSAELLMEISLQSYNDPLKLMPGKLV